MATHTIAPKPSMWFSLSFPCRGTLDVTSGRRRIPSHFNICAIHTKELKDKDSEKLQQPIIGSSSHQYKDRHRYFPLLTSKILNLYASHTNSSDHRSFYTWTMIQQRKDLGTDSTTNKMRAIYPSTSIPIRFLTAKKRDFYEVLGVAKESDKATIKKAYFNLAKLYHPDTNKVRFICRHKTHGLILSFTLSISINN